MADRLPSGKNRAVLNYLLIILAFALLAGCVYLFFKGRIRAIEQGAGPASGITQQRTATLIQHGNG